MQDGLGNKSKRRQEYLVLKNIQCLSGRRGTGGGFTTFSALDIAKWFWGDNCL